MKDVFEDGHVDVAIFQPTYLKEWYKEGFNTTERNAVLAEKHPGKFVLNTRWDPREGDAGLKALRGERVERWGCKGVKLYTAGVAGGLARLEAHRPGGLPVPGDVPGAGHQEHPRPQGPDDLAAGQGRLRRLRRRPRGDRLPELNFIVEHVGLPRIEDFCFMATQEPNVYAGCPWSSAG